MLKRLELVNYKSVAFTFLELSKENVIVGTNGSGKSNLIDAINFVRDIAAEGLDYAVTKRHGIKSIRRWSKTRPFNVSVKMSLETGENFGDYKITIGSSGGDFFVVEEEGSWSGKHPFLLEGNVSAVTCTFKRSVDGKIAFSVPDNPFSASMQPQNVSKTEALITQFSPALFTPYNLFFSALHEAIASSGAYSIYPNKIREPQSISNALVLSDDGANLASIVRQMRSGSHRESREALTSALQQVLPIIRNINIESAGGFYVPVFRVKESESSSPHDLNMSQISDGTLRMLGMLTAFYQPYAPLRITLEEPEQMIHPGLIPILIEAARDYVDDESKYKQVIFTTHSPTFLDSFEIECIIGSSFDEGITSFVRPSQRQLDIVRSRLFTAGDLLVAEGFVQ